jgi:hypothetical protein
MGEPSLSDDTHADTEPPPPGGFGFEQEPHLGGYIVGGDPDTFAPDVWSWLTDSSLYGIKSVIDIGAGEGHAAKWFQDKGLEVCAVEGGTSAVRKLNEKFGPYGVYQHDYTKRALTLKPFDLAWCCEFVEHVDEKHMPNFLATFACARIVAMTHAVPGQGGHHHTNCRDAEYWRGAMAAIGYRCDMDLSLRLRAMTNALWVKRSLMIFWRGEGV